MWRRSEGQRSQIATGGSRVPPLFSVESGRDGMPSLSDPSET